MRPPRAGSCYCLFYCKLALKQGFSALVTVISLIYSAVCVAGSCLDLQQPAVEARILLLWQFPSSTGFSLVFLRRNAPATMWLSLPTRVLCVLWLVLARIFSSRLRRGAQGEAALLVGFVIVFSDSDRVGRGEWSRVYDACMVVRVYFSWTARIMHAETYVRMSEAAENSSSLSLRWCVLVW